MADINNRNQFRTWLGEQPREAAVALAARAALRVLPVVQTAKHENYTGGLVLPVFRAASVSWAAAKYPAYETEFVTGAAFAYAAAVAAAAATSAAAAAADAAAIAAADAVAYAPAYAGDAYAPAYAAVAAAAAYSAAYAAVAAVRAAAAVRATARANAVAPTVAETAVAAVARAAAARAAAAAAARADDAIYSAAYSDARTYADDAYAGDAASPFFWSAVSADATRLEEGTAASVIATLPLWPQGQPDHLRSLWQELEAGLLAANQDWQVWTNWYNDRVDGRVREDERELAYVHIDEALWNRGPAIVNAEIARRVERSLNHLGAAREKGSLRPAAKPQDTNQLEQIKLYVSASAASAA